jgi:hypothetical protein
VFYVSVAVVLGILAFRVRSDRGRPPARFVAAILSVVVFGILGAITGRGLAWWALAFPVALVSLQPGLRLADAAEMGLPRIRARTAREAAESENRRSPLNTVVIAALVIAGVALLPLWRPVGPAGVPLATLSHAPQGIAAALTELIPASNHHLARVWNPQLWGSWLEWAVPQACYATDSRIELFPAEVWSATSAVATGQPDSISILGEHVPGTIVLAAEQRANLEPLLAASGAWTLRYEDADGAIWTHRSPTIITGFEGCASTH